MVTQFAWALEHLRQLPQLLHLDLGSLEGLAAAVVAVAAMVVMAVAVQEVLVVVAAVQEHFALSYLDKATIKLAQ